MGEYEPLSIYSFPTPITLANGGFFTNQQLLLKSGKNFIDPASATWSLRGPPSQVMTITNTGLLSATSVGVANGTYDFVVTVTKGSDTVSDKGVLTVSNSQDATPPIVDIGGVKNMLQANGPVVVAKSNAGVNWYLIIVILLILLFIGVLWYKNRKVKEVVVVDDE